MPGQAPGLVSLHVLEFEDNAISSRIPSPQSRGSAWIGIEAFPQYWGEGSIIVNPLDSIAGSQLRQNVSTNLGLLLSGKVHPDCCKPLLLCDIGRLLVVL
jgi:hypothetical protein